MSTIDPSAPPLLDEEEGAGPANSRRDMDQAQLMYSVIPHPRDLSPRNPPDPLDGVTGAPDAPPLEPPAYAAAPLAYAAAPLAYAAAPLAPAYPARVAVAAPAQEDEIKSVSAEVRRGLLTKYNPSKMNFLNHDKFVILVKEAHRDGGGVLRYYKNETLVDPKHIQLVYTHIPLAELFGKKQKPSFTIYGIPDDAKRAKDSMKPATFFCASVNDQNAWIRDLFSTFTNGLQPPEAFRAALVSNRLDYWNYLVAEPNFLPQINRPCSSFKALGNGDANRDASVDPYDFNALAYAVFKNMPRFLELLLKGPLAGQITRNWLTPDKRVGLLQLAVHNNTALEFRCDLVDPINANIPYSNNQMPLDAAAMEDPPNRALVRKLLDATANPNPPIPEQKDQGSLLLKLLSMDKKKGEACAIMLIEAGADVAVQNARKESALYLSLKLDLSNAFSAILALFKARRDAPARRPSVSANLLDARTVNNESVLIHAIRLQKRNYARQLLQAGADSLARSASSETSLVLAMRSKDTEIFDEIIRSHTTFARSAVELLEALFNEETVLIHAVRAKEVQCTKALLTAGANVNAVSRGNESCLLLALQINSIEIFEALLARNPRLDDRTGAINPDAQETVLIHALSARKDAYVSRLIRAGCHCRVRNSAGEVALLLAMRGNMLESFTQLLQLQPSDRIAVDDVAVLTVPEFKAAGNEPRETTLLHAIRQLRSDYVEKLLQYGASVSAKTADGDTCVLLLLRQMLAGVNSQQHLSLLKTLLKAGASAKLPDAEGLSPLFLTTTQGLLDAVSLLLASDAPARALPTELSPVGIPTLIHALMDLDKRANPLGSVQALLSWHLTEGKDHSQKEPSKILTLLPDPSKDRLLATFLSAGDRSDDTLLVMLQSFVHPSLRLSLFEYAILLYDVAAVTRLIRAGIDPNGKFLPPRDQIGPTSLVPFAPLPPHPFLLVLRSITTALTSANSKYVASALNILDMILALPTFNINYHINNNAAVSDNGLALRLPGPVLSAFLLLQAVPMIEERILRMVTVLKADVNEVSPQGVYPLLMAVALTRKELATALLAQGARARSDSTVARPLVHYVLDWNNNCDRVFLQKLLDAGAEIHRVDPTISDKLSPLHRIILMKRQDLFDVLVGKALMLPATAPAGGNADPLVDTQTLEKVLLSRTGSGASPLFLAAGSNQPLLVEKLLQCLPEQLAKDVAPDNALIAFHIQLAPLPNSAPQEPSFRSFLILSDEEKDRLFQAYEKLERIHTINILQAVVPGIQKTLLEIAVDRSDVAGTLRLLRLGANPNSKCIGGEPILIRALNRCLPGGILDVSKLLEEKAGLARRLSASAQQVVTPAQGTFLSLLHDPTTQLAPLSFENTGVSILLRTMAAFGPNLQFIDELIERGVNVNDAENDGAIYPLQLAINLGEISVAKHLILAGAVIKRDVSHPGVKSLICSAVETDDAEWVEFVLKAGANVNNRMPDGRSALHVAIERRQATISSCLIRYQISLDALSIFLAVVTYQNAVLVALLKQNPQLALVHCAGLPIFAHVQLGIGGGAHPFCQASPVNDTFTATEADFEVRAVQIYLDYFKPGFVPPAAFKDVNPQASRSVSLRCLAQSSPEARKAITDWQHPIEQQSLLSLAVIDGDLEAVERMLDDCVSADPTRCCGPDSLPAVLVAVNQYAKVRASDSKTAPQSPQNMGHRRASSQAFVVSDRVERTIFLRLMTKVKGASERGHRRAVSQPAQPMLDSEWPQPLLLSVCVGFGQDLEAIRLTLSKNVDVNRTDEQGTSPLFYAVSQRWSFDTIQTLLGAGALVQDRVVPGRRAPISILALPLWNQQQDVLDELLRYGSAPIEAWDDRGFSLLHIPLEQVRIRTAVSVESALITWKTLVTAGAPIWALSRPPEAVQSAEQMARQPGLEMFKSALLEIRTHVYSTSIQTVPSRELRLNPKLYEQYAERISSSSVTALRTNIRMGIGSLPDSIGSPFRDVINSLLDATEKGGLRALLMEAILNVDDMDRSEQLRNALITTILRLHFFSSSTQIDTAIDDLGARIASEILHGVFGMSTARIAAAAAQPALELERAVRAALGPWDLLVLTPLKFHNLDEHDEMVEFHQRISKLEDGAQQLRVSVSDLQLGLRTLGQTVEVHDGKIRGLDQHCSRLDASIERVDRGVSSVDQKLSHHRSKTEQDLSAVEKKVQVQASTVDGHLETLRNDGLRTRSRLDEVSNNHQKTSSAVQTLQGRLAALEQENQRLHQLENRLRALESIPRP